MDTRRTILWMIFSFSLLFLWNNWQVHNGKPSLFGGTPPATQAEAANEGVSPQPQPGADGVPIPQEVTAPASAVPSTTAAPVQTQAEPVVVTTDVVRLTFDPVGARVVKAELLKYGAVDDANQPVVLLDSRPGLTYVAETGTVGQQGAAFPTHRTPFQVTSTQRELTGDTLEVAFEATSGGVRVVKTYTLHRGRYDIGVRHDVTNVGDAPVAPSVYLQLTRDGSKPAGESSFYSTFTGPAVYSEADKFQKISFTDIDRNRATFTTGANNGWIAMVQHYFVSAWVPQEGTQRTNGVVSLGNNLYAVRTIESMGTIAPQESRASDAQLWVGPQDQKALEQVAPGLGLVVDYGWLTVIAKPLFAIMTWLFSMIGNWGWTIVALTVLIKLVFFPLSAASYRSMAKMKQVAPRLQALKERFGDDKQKLNAAMMEMYRTEKINPLGGCLPILVQIPVFISLYWVLLASVEMRGAPWILWIQDLSVRDPWFILPAVMMATMFLQIKLNPTPPDPLQAKVMMAMPLIFGGMMFFFPSGLVLYWVVNNILSIGQQWYITRKIANAPAKAA
ncbi:membrane protein insertase YidC [Achromobacter sp. GG226]|uniref:membrane protein insertase YidC n=1 Tax=Verticiella alkaliphila TaxID=2779529 RepID=UPI001C0D4285|nr:membrane protein insertase YidC [Verticiella sp. GG226]MBU4609360.1 membrane protein insertase YidC [Verticiella sp. GG226]